MYPSSAPPSSAGPNTTISRNCLACTACWPPQHPHQTFLCALRAYVCCCSQSNETLWQNVFMGRFGLPSKNQQTAHKLAESWQVGDLTTCTRALVHLRPSVSARVRMGGGCDYLSCFAYTHAILWVAVQT